MDIETIKRLLEQALDEVEVDVKSDDGHHFAAVVVSDHFIGKSRIDRQRQVYAVLGDLIATGQLHALSLKTYTQAEWQAAKQA